MIQITEKHCIIKKMVQYNKVQGGVGEWKTTKIELWIRF